MLEVLWTSPARVDYESERSKGPFVDGDTFIIERLLSRERPKLKEGEVWVRLLEVDTAENRDPTKAAWLAAKEFTQGWLEDAERNSGQGAWPFIVQAIKKDVFGRLLCYLMRVDTGEMLHDALYNAGHTERIPALVQLRAVQAELDEAA